MEAPPLERRLAAILAADVEGYSRLMHGDEEATLATLSAHRAIVDELIAKHKGRIANTAGDSVLAEFASVLGVVRCAVEIQEKLAQTNEAEPEERRMRFRIGINVGDIMVKEGDIFGDGVNVAARLEGLVKGGEICVSRGVHDHLRHRPGMVFEDLGEQLVKNIAHPIRAFRLHIADIEAGKDPPSAEAASEPPEMPAASAEISELSADTEAALELAFWESVKDGSPAEIESYLDRFPEGTFAALAKTRLDAALSPESIPDPATATSELSADSEAALELAFWESVKDGTPAELETYLEKYPEGTFASLARARLESAALSPGESSDPEAGNTGPDALDLAFWDSVKDSNRREELEAYLEQHPNGHFAALARARLSSPDVT
ncbi:MAG: adenylate/guanylate cyclase domain-containing protein [Alphaproteobacteria bacterium]|nr:adenylate/guanylate cyclase domain-containing protein [Alphaproteobacteria bacterium]